MAPKRAPIQQMDHYLLNSALLNSGVTLHGTLQFLQGLLVTSQADRDVLRSTFSERLVNASPAQSALLKFGVTAAGAYQFLQGLPVVSQADRVALRAMFVILAKPLVLQESGQNPRFKIKFETISGSKTQTHIG
jgi:hypothetical protein